MTHTIIRTTTLALGCALLLAGAVTVNAAEVVGTLSSVATNTTQSDGSLNGTVVSESGSSSGGSRSNRGNGSQTTPSGTVLGASTQNGTVPGFPNAGTAPEVIQSETIWSSFLAFVRQLFVQ